MVLREAKYGVSIFRGFRNFQGRFHCFQSNHIFFFHVITRKDIKFQVIIIDINPYIPVVAPAQRFLSELVLCYISNACASLVITIMVIYLDSVWCFLVSIYSKYSIINDIYTLGRFSKTFFLGINGLIARKYFES